MQPPPALPWDCGGKGLGADKEEPGVASQLLPARHAGRAGISAGSAGASPGPGWEGGVGLPQGRGDWGSCTQQHVCWQPALPRAPAALTACWPWGHSGTCPMHPSLEGSPCPLVESPLPRHSWEIPWEEQGPKVWHIHSWGCQVPLVPSPSTCQELFTVEQPTTPIKECWP